MSKRVFVTKQARGFLEKLRKETDKFNAQLTHGIDRKALEAASDALLAMKHNLLAMSDGNALPSEIEEDTGKKSKPRKSRKGGVAASSVLLVLRFPVDDVAEQPPSWRPRSASAASA